MCKVWEVTNVEVSEKKYSEVICPLCNENMTITEYGTVVCEECDILIMSNKKCPECGDMIWEYNDSAYDTTLGEYCHSKDCEYEVNQFLTWEEIRELKGRNQDGDNNK